MSKYLNFTFKSTDHLRYKNGKHVSGPHGGAGRAIKVEPNINNSEGYTVTIFNLDGNHPIWENNVQMAPKQMKITEETSDKVTLLGFSHGEVGSSFSDYGLTIHLVQDEVVKCILHLFDREVDIEYTRENNSSTSDEEPEIISLSKIANTQFGKGNISDGKKLLNKVYHATKDKPGQLKKVADYSALGTTYLLMLEQNISNDIDTQQMIASIGYLYLSKAIEKDKRDTRLYKDRLMIVRKGYTSFKYTVMKAFDLAPQDPVFSIGMSPERKASVIIDEMEIADLEMLPKKCKQTPFLKKIERELSSKLGSASKENTVKTGFEKHKKMLEYLFTRVIENEDIDFS